ncbi:MAG TPA: GH116 family glycosyl hydrolase [Ktedonobacteraceae bacterium]|nr:GH116 family glycosyl hydrolase [Ktedonobacteraceae bacterium]
MQEATTRRKKAVQGIFPLSGIPLGGLGTGTIEIRSDGALHEWQMFNNPPWSGGRPPWTPVPPSPLGPGDSLFAVRTRRGEEPPVIRMLRQRDGAEDAFSYFLPYVGTVQEISMCGEFPFAWLEYSDPALPVRLELEAWSSFIPGDVKHSALPAAVLTFHVENPTDAEIEVSLLGVMPHIGGTSIGAGRQVMREERAAGLSSLIFTADEMPATHPMAGGSFAFSAPSASAVLSASLLNHSDLSMWDAWARGGPFAPAGATDPFGTMLKRLQTEQADLGTVYQHIPSLLRGGIEGSLVPERVEFQRRVADDPIRYQDSGWRWLLILELNLPAELQRQFRAEVAADSLLRTDLAQARTRLLELGAEEHLLASRAPFWTRPQEQGMTRGAISQTITLAAGAHAEVTFLLSWFYPNHRGEGIGDELGHRYEVWFTDALDVTRYVAEQRAELYTRTKAFHDAQYSASAPYWLIDAINAQLTTMIKSSWLVRDGRFGIWEGLGCCGLQTLDVSYYGSHPVALLFPELERRQLQMTADFQLTPDSPHYDEYFLAFPRNRELVARRVAENPRLALDPAQRRAMYRAVAQETGLDASGRIPHFFPATFAAIDAYHMVDLMPKFALQAWRDYQWTGDLEALRKLWPAVKAAMEHARRIDETDSGLLYHYDHAPQETAISSQTYDTWDFIGYSAYVSSIWLAALKATARMARVMDDPTYAQDMEEHFLRAQASMERLLWNGEYYDLWVDPLSGRRNESCMADQVCGQLYASLLDLGDILPREHLRSACRAIFRYNRAQGRGLLNGALPEGKRADEPANWTLGDPRFQSDTVWSGTEYAVAVQMLQEGLIDEGLTILRAVYERYEQAGQTWDHQECGGHYYRAMTVWLVWLALGGIHYDAPARSLAIQPLMSAGTGHWRQPLVFPGFWGSLQYSQAERRCVFTAQEGQISLDRLSLPGEIGPARVMLGQAEVEARQQQGELAFTSTLVLVGGNSLDIRW